MKTRATWEYKYFKIMHLFIVIWKIIVNLQDIALHWAY